MLDARQLVGTHDVLFVTLLFACGGVKPGQVLGAIDKTAAFPPPNPRPFRICFVRSSPQGRPVPIVDGGKVIKDLV